MMCVNDTLPPRARARWLLITMRLSIKSLTGTDRTLVAVGTARLASMFCAVRAGAPRRTVSFGSSLALAGAGCSGSLGTGRAVVGWAGRASARGLAAAGAVTLGCAGAFAEPWAGAARDADAWGAEARGADPWGGDWDEAGAGEDHFAPPAPGLAPSPCPLVAGASEPLRDPVSEPAPA